MSVFFKVDDLELRDDRLFLIAGPCVIEDEGLCLEVAREAKRITGELGVPYIFTASFDKANRSSVNSFRGPGLVKGLEILARVKGKVGVPVLSDIHEPGQAVAAAAVLSVLQIPAFLCRQTDLLLAAARTGKPLNVKKGQFMAPEDMALVAHKLSAAGNRRFMLTERGTFFGYGNLVVDFRSLSIMKKNACPVVLDVTHSVQRPTADGETSGGDPEFIPALARAGVAAGANGIFLEIHPEPARALSDGKNSLALKNLENLLIALKKVYNAAL
jgi:2-dehydro-3-deoxyphosphooctonate aldolase (KDO 8-P synthase)